MGDPPRFPLGGTLVAWRSPYPDEVGVVINVLIAIAVGVLIMRVGMKMLSGFATPPPEPPPAGELRRVKIMYRCEICGSEVRMTVARDQDPEPPRHCMDEMTLVAPVE